MIIFILASIICIFNIILGVVVLFRKKGLLSFVFFLFTVSVTIWAGSIYLSEYSTDTNIALNWMKLTFISSTFIPLLLYYFSRLFPEMQEVKLFEKIFVIIPFFVSFLVLNNYIVVGVEKIRPITPIFGSFYFIFSSYFLLFILLSFFILFKKLMSFSGVKKSQTQYVLFGLLLALLLGIFTNLILPSLGLQQYGKLGPFSIIFFIAFTTYAIVRHHLMDIRFIIVKSITYTFIFITIAFIYTFFIFILGALVFKSFTGREAYWSSIIVALVIAFTLQPIKKVFTKWTDKIFFKDHYNFEELTSKLNEVATSTIILPELLFKFLNSLIEEMRVARGAIILLENKEIYETESVGHKKVVSLEKNEINHLLKEGKIAVYEDLEEGSKIKDILRKNNTTVILPLRTEGEIVGFLFIGEKKSGDIFTQKDIKILEIITSQVALGIQNAKAYEKTQKFNLILRAEINRATKELRDANEKLTQADKSKDEFISLASHEIRTPIATLEGYLSMLNMAKVGTKEKSEIAKRSYESVGRLSTLAKDLLDVSRIDQKRLKINKTPTRLERLIERTIEGFELQSKDRGIYLKFKKPDKYLPEINIDPDRLSEVFNNLIGNAMKFTSKGGITISLYQKGKDALVEVSDTGTGIPKDSISHLFEKFYQAEQASSVLSNEKGGTGLGLYITRHIIEAHGGKIWVESTYRKGTTFSFTLPIK